MIPMRYRLLLSFFLCLGIPQLSEAQKSYALGIAGGAAIPEGKFRDSEKTGGTGMVALAMGVADLPLGFRLDGIYARLPRRDVVFPQGGSNAVYSMQIIGGIANLIYAFPGTSAKPYLIAGAGYYNTKSLLSTAKSDNNVGFNGGLGVTFGLGPFGTFLEARYHSISRNASKGGVIQFVPVTLGLIF